MLRSPSLPSLNGELSMLGRLRSKQALNPGGDRHIPAATKAKADTVAKVKFAVEIKKP